VGQGQESKPAVNQKNVFVTGLGLVTALGSSVQIYWDRLLQGETAVHLRQPFAELPVIPLGMVGKHPAKVQDLLTPALTEALEDAGLHHPLPDCGVVIGSSRSFQGQIETMMRPWLSKGTSPDGARWMESLPHMAAMTVAQSVGSTGPVVAPMAACATGLWAIFQGAELIRQGRCDRAIVGAVEAPITPLTIAGFLKMGALAQTGCYPFSSQREGLVLGEGAAVLMLESAESLIQRSGPKPYGQILGAGFSADAYHMTSPDPKGLGGSIALQNCLHCSGLRPADIDYIHPHGTSTELNDQLEASLIQANFPQLPPISSSKGATGHTLGASGAIGAIVSLLAVRYQTLPPNVVTREDVIYPNIVTTAMANRLDTVLCFSFGFGGQNAVLALKTSDRGAI
jgi:3-oxoacyl-[acyl-carrier-protein] synthase II